MAMVAISRKDLDRITSYVNNQSIVGSCDPPRREQLKQLSDARVAGWTDTLAAKRKAKLEWKAEKARQDEEQRKVQDAKDAARHQNVRIETLQNADRLMLEQTEKVRQFRSQQMLVDTVETRDAQLKEQEEKKRKEDAMEHLWHMAVMENMQKAEEKSKREQEREKQLSLKLAEDQRLQRDEYAARIQEEQQLKLEEEKNLIEKMSKDDSEALKTEQKRKSERIRKAKDSMEKNKLLLERRQEEIRRKELELTRKCDEELAKQNRINAARAELEIKHFEEKQAMKKMLSDKAAEDLKQRAQRECELFDRDVRLRNQRAQEKAEATRIKREQEKVAIHESRQQQLQCKLRREEAERKLGDLYAKELARVTSQQKDLERDKELARRKKNIELRKMQQKQVCEVQQRRSKEKAEELKEERGVFQKLKKEDDIFQDFVAKEIEKFKAQGKRTALLEKSLNKR